MSKYTFTFLGDSHTRNWSYARDNNLVPDYMQIQQVIVESSKSAQGLHKDRKVELFLDQIQEPANYIALSFGEVDIGYAMWSRMKRNGTSVQEEVEYATDGLIKFAVCCKQFADEVVFLSPIIPLIADYFNYNMRKPATAVPGRTLRQQVEVPIEERTECTMYFEELLKADSQFQVISINNELRNPQTGIIKDEYIDLGSGWHLPSTLAIELWSSAIYNSFIEEGRL
jgi:hypothetical protein